MKTDNANSAISSSTKWEWGTDLRNCVGAALTTKDPAMLENMVEDILSGHEFNKKKSQQKTLGAPVSDFGLITANGASILTGGDILSRPLYLVGISVGSLSAPGEMPPTKKKLVQRHRDEMVLFDVKGLK